MALTQDLPHVRDALLDAGGSASRAYYLFFERVDANIKQALSDIVALQDESGGGGSSGNVTGSMSIQASGALPGVVVLYLAGDADAPGNTYYYGTNASGAKGFYTVASAFLGAAGDITLTTGSDGVTTIDLANVVPGASGTLQAVSFDAKGRVSQQHAVTVTGAAHRITVTGGDGSGSTINVTTPQDIDTTSSPTFASVNLAADPSSALQAATKQYVDTALAGLSWKAPAVCATTANITLSGLQTIDGYTTVSGDRVLVMAQTSAQNNGIYIAATGAWQRASDMATWAQVPNASLWVEKGTVNADTAWTCTADPGGSLGTTPISFVKFGPVFVGVTSFNGRSGVVVPTSGDYTFSLIGGTALATQGGTGQTTYTLGDIIYSSASNTLAKLGGNITAKKQFLSQTGTGSASAAPVWSLLGSGDIPWPSDYISGLKLIWNNATSISVGTGEAVIQSTGLLEAVSSTLTLSGLSLSASTFYHVYLFDNSGTPAIECVTTAPAAAYQGSARSKTGDTSRRYLGSVLTDASGNLWPFLYSEGRMLYLSGNGSGIFAVLLSGSATTPTAISLSGIVPTSASMALLRLANNSTTVNMSIGMTTTSGFFVSIPQSSGIGSAAVSECPISAQAMAYQTGGAGGNANIAVLGYIFER